MTERVALLGSTGSVGLNTLEVVRRHPGRFRVMALTARSSTARMLEQCLEFCPEQVVMVDTEAALALRTMLAEHDSDIEVLSGGESLERVVGDADCVVCAIVGAVGLASTMAAVRAGAKVLIANKEPLVMLGPAIMRLARRHGAVILPLDSEHNAIFQCLPSAMQQVLGESGMDGRYGIRRLLLTGSGGPFRQRDPATLASVTPDEACAHPNWDMGRKISVDSATMMNKGLELIEACSLFSMDESSIEIVVHPQSVVHSMVEFVDGSVLAQMANPDMKVPIANALSWPDRIESGAAWLDLPDCARFDFESPDHARFPSLGLAREVARTGGTAPAMLNAANEVAVDAFLAGEIGFDRITELVAGTLDQLPVENTLELETVLEADRAARASCTLRIREIRPVPVADTGPE
ncbi:MAG: 1-deoxy-D-xylulose-5-phosphate reductoisomerase [Gammaproteobacteria bacterium]|nr:1-deoxy-D-xylulose-5-phosphate reductoisomerase [Gammaproteobacteria bacterium]